MSNAGLASAAIGVSMLADASDVAQTIKTIGEINLVLDNFTLYKNYDDKLGQDVNQIFVDSVSPDKPGEVARDQTQKEIDTNLSDQANGLMNSLIEGRKQVVGAFGNNMVEIFAAIEPIKQLILFFTGVIAKRL